jgi:hypothetical protein
VLPDALLGSGFFLKDPGEQGRILLHELLHYETQSGDLEFDQAHGITGVFGDDYSSALQGWIDNDCNNPR